MTHKAAKPVGRPPSFSDGFSRTSVRLRLTRAQWLALELKAESQGKSFREFLRSRLRAAIADVLEGDHVEANG